MARRKATTKKEVKPTEEQGKKDAPKKVSFADYVSLADDPQPTDILALDIILGGGFERGDLIEIASPPGVGKSTTCMHLVRNRVNRKKRCLFLDIERATKKVTLTNFGLHDKMGTNVGDDFLLLNPMTFNEVEDVLDSVFSSGVEYDTVVIDSMKAILIGKAADQKLEDIEIGLRARMEGAFFEKYKPLFRKTGTTLWLINQMRTKMSGYGKFFKARLDSAASMSMQHFCDIRLMMEEGAALTRNEKTVEGPREVIYGNEARLWADKNRGNRPKIKITMPVIFGQGVSNVLTLYNIMRAQDVISGGHGGWFTVNLEGQDIPKIHSKAEVISYVKQHYGTLREYMVDHNLLTLTSGSDEVG